MKNKNNSRLRVYLLLTALLFMTIPVTAPAMAADSYSTEEETAALPAGDAEIMIGRQWDALSRDNSDYCWVSYEAYIGGYSDGTVRPNAEITREEVAHIFYILIANSEYFEISSNNFSDVTSDRWSNTAISTLARLGILNGYSDGTFRPDREITRAEFVKIAASFMGLKDINTSKRPFSDISGHWALKYILHAEGGGWINGYSDGTFRPDQNITRAEAIKITNALSGREAGHINRIENMKTWPDNTDESAWYYTDIQVATNSYSMAPRD